MDAVARERTTLRHSSSRKGRNRRKLPNRPPHFLVGVREVDPASYKSADYERTGPRWQFKKTVIINTLLTMTDRLRPLFSGTLAGVERLAKKAAEAVTLATLVRQELPEPLRPHVVGVVRRADDVVVLVDSAAWSARVRYAGPRLKEKLAELGEPVSGKVRVRVRGAERKQESDQ